jgi:creatinine amidohydrolase/Fe(II)-dependent formamide hydrolase-like protein
MTGNNNVRIEALTRQELREGRDRGHYRAAILALGSIEQHLEHLAVA